MDIYVEKGFKDRRDWLNQLAEDSEVDAVVVYSLANVLGPSEDFDGLVVAIDDIVADRDFM
jgi:hypothetical protein